MLYTSHAAATCADSAAAGLPFCNTSLPFSMRAEDLLSRLNLTQKWQQMTMQPPAIPELGLDELNFGGEALHGVWASCVRGRCPTQFPAPLAMGATFDADLWRAVGAATGAEARALYATHNATGLEGALGLTFYAPNVNLLRDGRWGRAEEVPSEDPCVNSR